ncbi:hypothetical protein LguiA_005149 [Lonicera macranthoides]
MKSILMDRSGKNSNKPSVLSVQGLLMAYCNWSWDELVAYDLLATIKHVHDETEQQLQYVGHALVCATKVLILLLPSCFYFLSFCLYA